MQDVALKTYRERWTIETGGGGGSERSVLAAWHDDIYIYIYIYIISHWIIHKGWYAIKHSQTNQTNQIIHITEEYLKNRIIGVR